MQPTKVRELISNISMRMPADGIPFAEAFTGKNRIHHADDDHGRTQQKAEQDARGNGGDAETEDQHDGRDGQDGLKRLQQLFPELGEG